MKFGRSIAIPAAVAGVLSSSFAMAPYSAQADENSELRANNEVLQQRIDQLAQIPAPGSPYPGGPPAPSAGAGTVGGSFPRSFLIPGTDTSLRIGGEIRASFLYWFNGGNPNSAHNTNAGATGQVNVIPINGSIEGRRGHNVSILSPQQSKLSVETRTPTALGEARTFIEFDFATTPANQRLFAVSDNITDRLRFAYATLGGFLGGQANSNFSDPDANVETISFSGLVGDPGHSRIPQVRYTLPLQPYGFLGALSFAAEQGETELWSPGVSGATSNICGAFAVGTCPSGVANPLKSSSPDFTVAWYIPQPWGHVDYSVAVRPTLDINDGVNIRQRYTGVAGHFGGDVKPGWFGWAKDFITWHAVGGDAAGPFLSAGSANTNAGLVSNFGGPGITAARLITKPVRSYGGNIGYRHQWTDEIRSNIGFGYYREDINRINGAVCSQGNQAAASSGGGGCGLNKDLTTAVANVFWQPVAFAEFGLEYFYGHRRTLSNASGDENVLLSRFRVQF